MSPSTDVASKDDKPTKKYSPDDWNLTFFMTAWVIHQELQTWGEFYNEMSESCSMHCGSKPTELQLQARLRTCARHLENGIGDPPVKYDPPPYPARPIKKKITLLDAIQDLDLLVRD